MKIMSLEEIFLFSLHIKESEIIDFFLAAALTGDFKDFASAEIDPGWPVEQAFVLAVEDNGHAGLGVKWSKEVATAIRGVIMLAKLSIVSGWRVYWGNNWQTPHRPM